MKISSCRKIIFEIVFVLSIFVSFPVFSCSVGSTTTETINISGSSTTSTVTATNICDTVPEYPCLCYECGSFCCNTMSVDQISQENFKIYRSDFIMDTFYTDTVEPSFKDFADDVRNAALFRVATAGAFLDGAVFSDTMTALQKLSAQILQRYTLSDEICRFGTLSRSLAESNAKVDASRTLIAKAGLDRNLGTAFGIASAGRGQDYEQRLKDFATKYCDLIDNNNGLTGICVSATPIVDTQHNNDIDFARLVDNKPTINADFSDTSLTKDESGVFSLANFLYGHRQLIKRLSYDELQGGKGELYGKIRSVVARRAAAQNTYATLTAMRSAGSGASDTYMQKALQELGVTEDESQRLLGAKDTATPAVKSSYNAQMELLSKRIYQDPAFFVNLMDSKSNVSRIGAAMQGVGLMQDRDIYRSVERSEMLLGVLVELEARKQSNNNQVER